MSAPTPSSRRGDPDLRAQVESAPTDRPPAPDGATPSIGVIVAAALPSIVSAATAAADAASGERAVVPMDAQSWIGRVIDDRYRILEVLGEGGMGSVFVAEHLKLPKQVALKVIRSEFAGNGEVAARFAREAMASAQLEHPHIASALDYGTLPEGGAYLVMQLVRGWSLREVLTRQGKQPWQKACRIGSQIADALAAAHAANIVHRDLKPDNVLIETRDDDSELVKVLDFGIARMPTDDSNAMEGAKLKAALTRVGTIVGTPGYMAPEQALGERVDHRADLYALGVVLFEMMVGHAPFEGEEMSEIFAKQLTETAPPVGLASGDPSVPAPLSALVAQLLAPKVERPDRASHVRDALRQLAMTGALSGISIPLPLEGAPATGQTPVAPLSPVAPIAPPSSTAIETLVQQARRLPIDRLVQRARGLPPIALAVGCALPAVLALAVVVIAVAVGASGDDEPTAPPQVIQVPVPVAIGPGAPRSAGGTPRTPATQPPRGLSPETAARVTTLFESDDRGERQSASAALLDPAVVDHLPPYVRLVAELERARGCQKKKPIVRRIGELGDPRALPALDRLSNMPESGCGFLGLSDCYSCMRRDLERVRGELPARFGSPAAAPSR